MLTASITQPATVALGSKVNDRHHLDHYAAVLTPNNENLGEIKSVLERFLKKMVRCPHGRNLGKKGNFCPKTSFLDLLQFPQLFETIFFRFPAFFYADLVCFQIYLVKF